MSLPVKFLHTSDLHLGKTLFGFSLVDDQKHILNEIIDIAKENDVDAILIAGDIYDAKQPPAEAIRLFSDFLRDITKICPVYAIAGNHDMADHIGYARELLSVADVHVTGRYDGKAEKFNFNDDVDIFILPYMTTSHARNFFRDDSIRNPDQAMDVTLKNSDIDPKRINVIVAHQFIAGHGARLIQADSETKRITIGTDAMVHSDLFDDFDYGAFGHIHKPQRAGRDELLYCGSPLKYSESEANDVKHVNIVTIKGKGDVDIEEVPLNPLQDMAVIKGDMDEVLEEIEKLPGNRQVYVTLTEVSDRANEILTQACQSNNSKLYHISFDIPYTSSGTFQLDAGEMEQMSDDDLFIRFYTDVVGKSPSEEEIEIIRSIVGGSE